MKTRYMAGAAPASFAHLMGAPAGRTRAESDDQDDKDMKARKARRAAEDKKRLEEDDRRKKEDAMRAEEDGPIEPGDPVDLDGDGEEPDCPECEGSGVDDAGETCELCGGDGKVHTEDRPDDVHDENGGDPDAKAGKGKKAERARWTKVLGNKAATGRVGAACSMLANGDMTAEAIVATLKALPQQAQARSGLRDRMAAERPANPGPNARGKAVDENAAFAAEVAAAAAKARGERT